MRDELERKLEENFVFMKKKHSLEEQKENGMIDNLYSAFGCECNDGWFDMLFSLCKEINDVYKKANMQPDIIIQQIKEKFGMLRFYFSFEGKEQTFHALDFLGVGGIRYMQEDNPVHKEIAGIVRGYEKKSGTICENCGSPGKLRTELPWVLTLCDNCHNERMSKRK